MADGHPPSAITEGDPERLRRLHEIRVHRHSLRLSYDVLERTRNNIGRSKGDHRPELPLLDELNRLSAKARRQHTIEARRCAAALQVTEHDRSRLFLRERRQSLA